MDDTTKSRRDGAPRAEKPRSAIAAYIALADSAGDVFDQAQRASFIPGQNIGGAVEELTRKAWVGLFHQPMFLCPTDDQDLLLLAAHTALMSEQLDGLIADDETENQRLVDGIKLALEAITDFLARRHGTAGIDAVSRELGRATRITMNLVAERRIAGEGR